MVTSRNVIHMVICLVVAQASTDLLRRRQAGIRQIVETVHDRLLATFGLDHERPHGLSGFRMRLDADCLQHDGLLYQLV
jgi:hypothetical protein